MKADSYEVVYTWPNGIKEVRYRRPRSMPQIAWEVRKLHVFARIDNYTSPYSLVVGGRAHSQQKYAFVARLEERNGL